MLRIKEAREARGWTQERLAVEMNTTQQTIQRWETGQTDPKASVIKEISKLLGVTVSFIMNVNETETSVSSLSSDEKQLISNYRKCNSDMRSTIRSLASSLAVLPSESEFAYREMMNEYENELIEEE